MTASDFGHTLIFTTNKIPIFNVFDDAKHLFGVPYLARSKSVPLAVEDLPTGKGIQDPGKIVAAAASKNLIVHFEHQVFAKLRFPGVSVVIKNPQNMTAIFSCNKLITCLCQGRRASSKCSLASNRAWAITASYLSRFTI